MASVGIASGIRYAIEYGHDLALSVPVLVESAKVVGQAKELERQQQMEWDAMISSQETRRNEVNGQHLTERQQAVGSGASIEQIQQLDAKHCTELVSLQSAQENEVRLRQEANRQSMEKALQPAQEKLQQAESQAWVLGR